MKPFVGLLAGVAQWLERHVANVNVEGSNPFTRFDINETQLTFSTGQRLRISKQGWVVGDDRELISGAP